MGVGGCSQQGQGAVRHLPLQAFMRNQGQVFVVWMALLSRLGLSCRRPGMTEAEVLRLRWHPLLSHRPGRACQKL